MSEYLSADNFVSASVEEKRGVVRELEEIKANDLKDDVFAMLGRFRLILADNCRRGEWEEIFRKLMTLFKCGRCVPLDGPMIGVTMAIRDSDYFRDTARLLGCDRSLIADIEWMATCWNATFAPTGLWMGKTFEPVSRDSFSAACGDDQREMKLYDPAVTRVGRNFFREPENPGFIQGLGLPVLTEAWRLMDRPMTTKAPGFRGDLLESNLEKERYIPYVKTGGYFLANPGVSVVPEMNGRPVWQLNYRWPALGPTYPMTRLVDELVQIADGVYLGQLVMASRRYSLGTLRLSLFGKRLAEIEVGEPYRPGGDSLDKRFHDLVFPWEKGEGYGYQNNGFFLMIDPLFAKKAYADNAFPFLRPRPGESGFTELGYDRTQKAESYPIHGTGKGSDFGEISDWALGWRENTPLRRKFTTFCLEPSPREGDGDVRELLNEGESILQMLQRIQGEISLQSSMDDNLRHFEKLNRLFRAGVAPRVVDGLFQGTGKGFNVRFDAPEERSWYGADDPCRGFDYYHGATLNLHLGFVDTISTDLEKNIRGCPLFPTALIPIFQEGVGGPNLFNGVWASIGRFIFPWAGKSFERISGRKLSMLLDESGDLEERYPERVEELRSHLASFPHYDLVEKNRQGWWKNEGPYARYLKNGAWDRGMSDADKAFWEKEAAGQWVFGNNIQDSRILAADAAFRVLDMNYHPPLPSIQALVDSGPSPFVRQGFIFLGVSDRDSILSMNNGDGKKKKVFQFHYRYPMIGGPLPIGTCLDELVEIAEGLFLGQLIYSTVPLEPYHSSVDPAEYRYQLFGYFLLLDNTWERHRRAIGFDVNTVS